MESREFEQLVASYEERIAELEDKVKFLSRAVTFFRDRKNLYRKLLGKALLKEI